MGEKEKVFQVSRQSVTVAMIVKNKKTMIKYCKLLMVMIDVCKLLTESKSRWDMERKTPKQAKTRPIARVSRRLRALILMPVNRLGFDDEFTEIKIIEPIFTQRDKKINSLGGNVSGEPAATISYPQRLQSNEYFVHLGFRKQYDIRGKSVDYL